MSKFGLIKDVFPEALEWIRGLKVGVRLLVGAVIVLVAFTLWKWPVVWPLLDASFELPRWALLLGGLFSVLAGYLLGSPPARWLRQARIRRFAQRWDELSSVFTRVQMAWEVATTGPGLKLSADAADDIALFTTLKAEVRALHHQIARHLQIRPIRDWDDLVAEDDWLRKRGYETPFELILDVRALPAALNAHADLFWKATQVADDFVEALGDEYPRLGRQLRREAARSRHRMRRWLNDLPESN